MCQGSYPTTPPALGKTPLKTKLENHYKETIYTVYYDRTLPYMHHTPPCVLSPSAALAADDATRGSTTDARKATVLMTGFSDWLKGTGWYASGPREADESSRYGSSMGRRRKWRMHSSCVLEPTCSDTLFQSSL